MIPVLPDFTAPAEDSLEFQQAPPPPTYPEETSAHVLDALVRQSSNTDRLPDRDSGRTVRGHSSFHNRPAKVRRPAKVGASSLFLFLRGVPEVSTLPLIIDYPLILSASAPENPESALGICTSRPQSRSSLPRRAGLRYQRKPIAGLRFALVKCGQTQYPRSVKRKPTGRFAGMRPKAGSNYSTNLARTSNAQT